MALICGEKFKWSIQLVANEHEERLAALEEMTDWLKTKTDITLDDAEKIWFILLEALWMTDRVPVQHDFNRRLAALIKIFDVDHVKIWTEAFIKQISTRWSNIDKHRQDKFMALVRYFYEELIDWVEKNNQERYLQDLFVEVLKDGPGMGFRTHFVDVVFDNMSRFTKKDTTHAKYYLMPFVDVFCNSHSQVALVKRIDFRLITPMLEDQGDELFGFHIDDYLKLLRTISSTLNASVKTPDPSRDIQKLRMDTNAKVKEEIATILKSNNQK